MVENAIILCSGGLDSVVSAYYVKKRLKYDKIKILFFDYGQRNLKWERKFSRICTRDLKAEFLEIDLRWLGKISKSLINNNQRVRKLKREDLKDSKKESEKYYVPCRNMIFLALALAFAESLYIKEKKKYDIFIGFKCEGKESYSDTTKEFVNMMNKLSETGTDGRFRILAPLIEMDKEDIILLGQKLGVDFRKTFSCYINSRIHCGRCLACMLRKEGFYWANMKDKTEYTSLH